VGINCLFTVRTPIPNLDCDLASQTKLLLLVPSPNLSLLKDPILINRILEDFDKCGVVGEECNKLVGYLACVSRKLDKPLAIVIQSTSAAGKSSLMDAILSLMPPDRWTSPDPLGFEDGPNLYAYVHGNPLRYFDRFGLFA
jgi:hypothetical protein